MVGWGGGARLFYTFTQWSHKCFTYCHSELFCSASKISEWFIFNKPSQTLIKAFKCFQFEINSLSKYSEIARGTSFSLFHCHVLVVSIFHVKLESRLNLNGESKLLLIIKMRAISSVKKLRLCLDMQRFFSVVVLVFVLLLGTFRNTCWFEGQSYALRSPCTTPYIEIWYC